MRRCLILFTSFFFTFGLVAQAAVEMPGAVHLQPGFFCALETVNTQEAEDTISGVVNLVEGLPEFLSHGRIVPAQIGVGFGVHVEPRPGFDGVVTITTVHPPMGPNAVTTESWQSTYTAGTTTYNGFTFEYDYELKPGAWSFTATANGRTIYHVDFTVVEPHLLPPVNCAGGLLS